MLSWLLDLVFDCVLRLTGLSARELSRSPNHRPLDKGSVALVVGLLGLAVILVVSAFVLLSRW
ncbi:MAG: hypothetical protein ACRD2M_08375 [Terriglobales bacterium]